MELKTGARLRSATDATEVIVVRAPGDAIDLRCGGQPMVDLEADRGDDLPIEAGFDDGTQIGKRYTDEDSGLELLCTKAGQASLSIGTEPLQIKGAKPLPSSD
jgi:hypothetical protein